MYFVFFVFNFLASDVRVQIKKSIQFKTVLFNWYTIIYLLYIGVNTNYFFRYYNLLNSSLRFDGKPIDDEAEFRIWADMSES